MKPCDPLLFRQLPLVQQIIADETWLEGERRGCSVSSDDMVVRENVCRVVLRVGREMRERTLAAMERERVACECNGHELMAQEVLVQHEAA